VLKVGVFHETIVRGQRCLWGGQCATCQTVTSSSSSGLYSVTSLISSASS
jgi:hypothetical protein